MDLDVEWNRATSCFDWVQLLFLFLADTSWAWPLSCPQGRKVGLRSKVKLKKEPFCTCSGYLHILAVPEDVVL